MALTLLGENGCRLSFYVWFTSLQMLGPPILLDPGFKEEIQKEAFHDVIGQK